MAQGNIFTTINIMKKNIENKSLDNKKSTNIKNVCIIALLNGG
jgi:hypothetical protein